MNDRTTCLDHPIMAENLEAIRRLGRECGVNRLEVFGSVCTPNFDPETSDVDFLVEYPEHYDFGPWVSRSFALKEALSQLLGCPVDLVMASAARNAYFVRSMNQTRQLPYAAWNAGRAARRARCGQMHQDAVRRTLRFRAHYA